jgi:hypothetical protein
LNPVFSRVFSLFHGVLAVDMLVANMQKSMLLQAIERGFPADINGNG